MNAIIESNGTLTMNAIYYKIGEFLKKEGLTVTIKGKVFPNRTGFRKLAMFLGISTEVTRESRVENKEHFLYEFTVKATDKDGRYTECSASCSSNEKDFNNLENDVRTTAQTRATNRAIADLLGIYDITKYIGQTESIETNIVNTENKYQNTPLEEGNTKDTHNITPKQKQLLIRLISEVFEDQEEQQGYIEVLDELTKAEANRHIKDLIEMKNEAGH